MLLTIREVQRIQQLQNGLFLLKFIVSVNFLVFDIWVVEVTFLSFIMLSLLQEGWAKLRHMDKGQSEVILVTGIL